MLQKGIVALGVFALALSAAGAQGKPPANVDEATRRVLIANERALYEALAKRDKAAFQSLVALDGVWTTPGGFVPMKAFADGLASYELPTWSLENVGVIWTDGSSALVLYARLGGGTFGRQPLESTLLASTLWTKRDGKWLAVHHQETALTQ